MDICKFHSKLPINDCPYFFTYDPTNRKKMIAALLRFADELDISSSRVELDTVKIFTIKRDNSVYWWLHNYTKVTFVGTNKIRVTVRLHPEDFELYGSFVQDDYIINFNNKNQPILDVLVEQKIPIVIDNNSNVIAHNRVEKFPPEITAVLNKKIQKNVVSFYSDVREFIPKSSADSAIKSIDFFGDKVTYICKKLGEGATGFTYVDDYAVLWIADGAPGIGIDFEGLHFNSRILAKCMGECFETVALRNGIPRTLSNDVFIGEFTAELHNKLSELLKSVYECLRKNKDSLYLDDILAIKMSGKEKTYLLIWSTNFVGAIIDIKNKICYIISMGNCIALVNNTAPKNSLSRIIPPSTKLKIITGETYGLLIELFIKENFDSSKIEITKSRAHIETTENIESIILMSDGVIAYNDIESKLTNKDVETIWCAIKAMNNKTDDDKTAIFFKIME